MRRVQCRIEFYPKIAAASRLVGDDLDAGLEAVRPYPAAVQIGGGEIPGGRLGVKRYPVMCNDFILIGKSSILIGKSSTVAIVAAETNRMNSRRGGAHLSWRVG